MGRKSRGGLTKAAYRADRAKRAQANAAPRLTREEHEAGRRQMAERMAAAPKPEHNTIHGTHTGPKDIVRKPVEARPTVAAYRVERSTEDRTDATTGETKTVVIEHRIPLAAAAVGAAAALALGSGVGDDGATPLTRNPVVPRGKIANDRRLRGNKHGKRDGKVTTI